jgi:hypothetical protein
VAPTCGITLPVTSGTPDPCSPRIRDDDGQV